MVNIDQSVHRPTLLIRCLHRVARWVDVIRLAHLRVRGVRSRMLPVADTAIHVLEYNGQGALPPILLVHGLSSCALDYDQLIIRLRKHCRRVIAFDLPGHGNSPRPKEGMALGPMTALVEATFEKLADEPHIVLGNSLGGFVTVRLAMRYPEKCRGLILVSPAGTPVTGEALAEKIDLFRLQSWASTRVFAKAFLANRHRPHPLLQLALRERMARPDIAELLKNINIESMLTAENLQNLRMPVHLFWGTDDEILDEPHFEFYRTNLPGQAQSQRLSGFGHAPHVDGLRGLMNQILPWMKEV
jgi:pimeloyl-ACP methyl ester carboxylesterase